MKEVRWQLKAQNGAVIEVDTNGNMVQIRPRNPGVIGNCVEITKAESVELGRDLLEAGTQKPQPLEESRMGWATEFDRFLHGAFMNFNLASYIEAYLDYEFRNWLGTSGISGGDKVVDKRIVSDWVDYQVRCVPQLKRKEIEKIANMTLEMRGLQIV